jgi:hypothetical protein
LYWKLVLLSGSFCIGRDCLSTHPANRTTVEVAIQIPAPLHSGGAARLRTDRSFRAAANSLQKARALVAPSALTASTFLGHRKLH